MNKEKIFIKGLKPLYISFMSVMINAISNYYVFNHIEHCICLKIWLKRIFNIYCYCEASEFFIFQSKTILSNTRIDKLLMIYMVIRVIYLLEIIYMHPWILIINLIFVLSKIYYVYLYLSAIKITIYKRRFRKIVESRDEYVINELKEQIDAHQFIFNFMNGIQFFIKLVYDYIPKTRLFICTLALIISTVTFIHGKKYSYKVVRLSFIVDFFLFILQIYFLYEKITVSKT